MSTVTNIRELDDRFLLCRDPGFGHDWQAIDKDRRIFTQGDKRGELNRISICACCSTRRTEVFQLTRSRVVKLRNKYEYPEDYLVQGIVIKGADVWFEGLRRARAA